MFNQGKDYSNMNSNELMLEILKELDEVKRYVANVYANTDNEISEIRDLARRIDQQVKESDRQIDKIEGFERSLTEIKSQLKSIERKV